MLQEGARCFSFFIFIFCFVVHLLIADTPSEFGDGDFDVQDDFLQHGFTVLNSTWHESKYRSADLGKEQYLPEEEEAILPSKTLTRLYKRQVSEDQSEYSADGPDDCGINNEGCVTELKDIKFTVTVNISYPELDNILNQTNSPEYQNLTTQMETALFAVLNETVLGLLNVTVIRMWKGSLITEAATYVDSTYIGALAKGIFNLRNATFQVGNITANVLSLAVNGREVTDVCDILQCNDGENCHKENNGDPVCMRISSADIIGLAVGIPLAFIAVVAVVVIVVIIVRKRRRAKALNAYDDDVLEHRSPFTQGIATRGSWGPHIWNSRPFLSPDSISNASSGSDNGRARMGALRVHKSDFTSWSDRESTVSEIRNPRNFSWDFFFEQLDPGSEFSIKRPKVALTPNPAFQSEAGVSSFS